MVSIFLIVADIITRKYEFIAIPSKGWACFFLIWKKTAPKLKKGLKSIIEMHWNFFPKKTFFPLKICAKKRHYYKPLASWSWSRFAICITKGVLLFRKFETLCGCNPLGLIHISSMALIKFGKDLNGTFIKIFTLQGSFTMSTIKYSSWALGVPLTLTYYYDNITNFMTHVTIMMTIWESL